MTTTITKLTPTPTFHPAVGRFFIIELSNGERFETNAETLLGAYCYDETKPVGSGFDDEMADRLVQNNFQELVGGLYKTLYL